MTSREYQKWRGPPPYRLPGEIPEVRPLDDYLGVFRDAGLDVEDVSCRPVEARIVEWFEFLAAYHEGVLGWVGGAERLEGRPASDDAVRDRLTLMRLSLDQLFGGGSDFVACWTHITCRSSA